MRAEEAKSEPGHVSKHVSDMILAPFRMPAANTGNATTAVSQATPVAAANSEPDAGIVKLEPFVVTDKPGPILQKTDAVVKEHDDGLPGTGVTEFKGRHFTFRLHRLFFIPVAFGFDW
jgi:hypothetical protein